MHHRVACGCAKRRLAQSITRYPLTDHVEFSSGWALGIFAPLLANGVQLSRRVPRGADDKIVGISDKIENFLQSFATRQAPFPGVSSLCETDALPGASASIPRRTSTATGHFFARAVSAAFDRVGGAERVGWHLERFDFATLKHRNHLSAPERGAAVHRSQRVRRASRSVKPPGL